MTVCHSSLPADFFCASFPTQMVQDIPGDVLGFKNYSFQLAFGLTWAPLGPEDLTLPSFGWVLGVADVYTTQWSQEAACQP
jgi:hypothetical protein